MRYRSTGPRAGFLRKLTILDGGGELRLFGPRSSGLLKLPKHLRQRMVVEAAHSDYIGYDTRHSIWLKHRNGLPNVCKSLCKGQDGTSHMELQVPAEYIYPFRD